VYRLVWGLEVLILISQGYRAYRLGNLKGEKAFLLHLDFLCLLVLRVLGHVLALVLYLGRQGLRQEIVMALVNWVSDFPISFCVSLATP